jgi:hypothetical protein
LSFVLVGKCFVCFVNFWEMFLRIWWAVDIWVILFS